MGEEKDYLVIRRPEISDALRIAVICSEGWRQTVDGTMSESFQRSIISFWYTEDKVAGDIRRGSYSYVAEVNGVVAGVIGGGMTALDTSKVFVFYVDREYRYRGIGKELLAKITEGHRKRGAVCQWVSVQEGNEHGLPFYEARGFVYQRDKKTKTETGEVQISRRYRREL
ncbi:MAG TPA: GNAT family N-acetyltransferase [Candidatus Salinicoccus stercoripullorum]|uniref:GNAT family N-acetyltransferase n=1 Tax=Candidatus Salinicoccus stercoripullorum TaxID=2838756 RepID=A0A9D1TYH7_9STAP|nr:GNAT family N-acetyltransferase [Candidatus Salinicoccus stercoripullorum]